jgi:hypothetical protein
VAGAAGRRGCTAIDYPAWRKARERAWKRDGDRYSGRTWPERIPEGELAAVLLMQSHGGHWRGQPAEIAVPTFAHGVPTRGHDIEQPLRAVRARPAGRLDEARARR